MYVVLSSANKTKILFCRGLHSKCLNSFWAPEVMHVSGEQGGDMYKTSENIIKLTYYSKQYCTVAIGHHSSWPMTIGGLFYT